MEYRTFRLSSIWRQEHDKEQLCCLDPANSNSTLSMDNPDLSGKQGTVSTRHIQGLWDLKVVPMLIVGPKRSNCQVIKKMHCNKRIYPLDKLFRFN